MQVEPARRSFWRNLSPIWLVPILALAVAVGIAWRSYAERGTLIEITFLNAAGVTPGETTLRFRDVVIGTVETVTFTPDLSQRRGRGADRVAGGRHRCPADAQFWVVRPQVSTRGISGLSTVLSGVYIQAQWTPAPGAEHRRFTGLESPPLIEQGNKGTADHHPRPRRQHAAGRRAGALSRHRGRPDRDAEAHRGRQRGDGRRLHQRRRTTSG